MTRDDIIQLALEHFGAVLKPSDLEVKLALLAVAQERETCAKVCEDIPLPQDSTELTHLPTIERCAAAIRARGE